MVADLDVLVACDTDTAFITTSNALDIVFEATQAFDLAFVDNSAIAHDTHGIVAADLAFNDVATSNNAHLGHLEGLAHFSDAGIFFHDIRRKQTDTRSVDVFDRLIDNTIQTNVDLLARSHFHGSCP